MQKNTKKEIQQIVEDTVLLALVKLKIKEPSKKIRKGLDKISKGLARFLKEELKREKRQAKSPTVKTSKKASKTPIDKSKKKKKS
jgi:hypothetical protein